MRRVLAAIGVGCALGACSLIYNPSNLPGPDAFQFKDAPFLDAPRADADQMDITVTTVSPATVFEGQGVDNSRPAILTMTGSNFTSDAKVTIVPTNPGDTADLTIGTVAIAGDGNTIAVPVTANIMMGIGSGSGTMIPLTVTVSEDGFTTTASWTETALDELTDAKLPKNNAVPTESLFSQINLTADATFKGSGAVILHSMSSIHAGAIHVDATGAAGGPGGCAGGAAGAAAPACGSGAGGANGGNGVAGIGLGGGGGGGFAAAGAKGGAGALGGALQGEPYILSYATDLAGGGGGGGNDTVGGAGGAGGGGGGTLELHAEGTLAVGALTANGANGASGSGNGGGGAGGAIVIRSAAANMSVTSVSVAAGTAPGSGNFAGGAGSVGRTRFDTPDGTVNGAQMGPSFDPSVPVIATTPMLNVKYRIPMQMQFTMTQLEADGSLNHLTPSQSGTAGGSAAFEVPLALGWNQLCLQVPGGTFGIDLQNECIEVAYITK